MITSSTGNIRHAEEESEEQSNVIIVCPLSQKNKVIEQPAGIKTLVEKWLIERLQPYYLDLLLYSD